MLAICIINVSPWSRLLIESGRVKRAFLKKEDNLDANELNMNLILFSLHHILRNALFYFIKEIAEFAFAVSKKY